MVPSPAKVKRKNSESADETVELQNHFRACDADHSGKIDKNELRAVMKQLNANQDVSDSMLETIYNVMDKNGDGFIDEEEFVEALRGFKHGAPGGKKVKGNFEDFFFQFIQAASIEEELVRIKVRVQGKEDTTTDSVRFNSHKVFKSRMAEARYTDVGMYKMFLYQNIYTLLDRPEFFLELGALLHSTNVEDIDKALVMVQELLYLPEAFVTQRERLEISLAILKVYDGLSYPQGNNFVAPHISSFWTCLPLILRKYLHFPHPPTLSYYIVYNKFQSFFFINCCMHVWTGERQPLIARICALTRTDNELIVLHALKCIRLYILGPRVNFSNKNSVWYPSKQSTRTVMHEQLIHSAVLTPLFTNICTEWMRDREGYLQRYPNGKKKTMQTIPNLHHPIPNPSLIVTEYSHFMEGGLPASIKAILTNSFIYLSHIPLSPPSNIKLSLTTSSRTSHR